MSQYEVKPGQGAMFPNPKHAENEKAPNLRGDLLCPHCEAALWMSAWTKVSAKGGKYLSLAAQAKDSVEPKREPTKQTPKQAADIDDEIPF